MALLFCFERDILAVRHRLALTLAKLTQHLNVRSAMPLGSSKNTIFAEFDIVEIRHDSAKSE